jgi:hypothetical protein
MLFDLLMFTLLLMGVLMIAGSIFFLGGMQHNFPWGIMRSSQPSPSQAAIKRDWLSTGRIDFASKANPKDNDPSEFKLLVEEHRIVESVSGNENLETHWRLATLAEAKAIVTHYHKYLSENGLIRSIHNVPASSTSQAAIHHIPSGPNLAPAAHDAAVSGGADAHMADLDEDR